LHPNQVISITVVLQENIGVKFEFGHFIKIRYLNLPNFNIHGLFLIIDYRTLAKTYQ